jgi:flagellar hook-associated protein 3 FlgL
MIVTRITPGLIANRTLRDINQQLARISELQERLATGRRVNRPSDDPIGASRAINARVELQKNERFTGNIEDIGPQLGDSENALQGVVDVFLRALELTTQAANGTNSQAQLDTIALEIDSLIESVFTAANTRTNGRSVFAGTRTLDDAYTATRVGGEITAVTYNGNDEFISINIADGSQIIANIPGSQAFQGTIDIFTTLIGIRDDMRAGDQASLQNVRPNQIQSSREQALFGLARVGATQNRLALVSEGLQDGNVRLRKLLSEKIDADYADTILNINVAQNAYQAALNAAGRVLQTSLLDYLR